MVAALPAWRAPDLPIRVGISSCLLGEEVRYDGGHQKDAYITGVLARHFTWVPVCPVGVRGGRVASAVWSEGAAG